MPRSDDELIERWNTSLSWPIISSSTSPSGSSRVAFRPRKFLPTHVSVRSSEERVNVVAYGLPFRPCFIASEPALRLAMPSAAAERVVCESSGGGGGGGGGGGSSLSAVDLRMVNGTHVRRELRKRLVVA